MANIGLDYTPSITKEMVMGPLDAIPEIPVFRPTWDEFKDFSKCVTAIEAKGAHHIGLCKIIPPKGWVARKNGYQDLDDFIVPRAIVQWTYGSNGYFFQDISFKRNMTVGEIKSMANGPFRTPEHDDWDHLEKKYWSSICYGRPIYGANVSGTITDPEQKVWNIAHLDSVLSEVLSKEGISISGVNTPYLYFGMWRATFAWHVEDVDLYSINYLHYGMPKHWYVIPPAYARKFESFSREHYKVEFFQCASFLRHKTVLVNPTRLAQAGIPTRKITQEQNEFIITFPYAFHAGFNFGFNIAESTNFALPRWIDFGKKATVCHCWNDTVKICMDPFVRAYQSDLYVNWMRREDKTPHPLQEYSPLVGEGGGAGALVSAAAGRRKRPSNGVVVDEPNGAGLKKSKSPAPSSGSAPSDIQEGEEQEEEGESSSHPQQVKRKQQRGRRLGGAGNGGKLGRRQGGRGASHADKRAGSRVVIDPKDILSEPDQDGLDYAITEEMLKGCKLPEPHGPRFPSLWIGTAPDFEEEKRYNRLIGSSVPHCAVCASLLLPNIVKTLMTGPPVPSNLRIPAATEPYVPEIAFTKNSQEVHQMPPSESRILNCTNCCLYVHARCYGLVHLDSSDRVEEVSGGWKCDRCMEQDQNVNCCMCPVRGGAYKRLANRGGRWAHIVCTIGVYACPFVDVVKRRALLPGPRPQWRKNQCALCGLADPRIPLAKCWYATCKTQVHVTCTQFAGVLVKSDFFPWAFYLACLQHKSEYRNYQVRAMDDVTEGEEVYAKNPANGRYCLASLQQLAAPSFCCISFSDGTYSNDTPKEFVMNHDWKASGSPTKNSAIRVMWHDNQEYSATFLDTTCEKWKLKFPDDDIRVVPRNRFYKQTEELPPRIKKQLLEATKKDSEGDLNWS